MQINTDKSAKRTFFNKSLGWWLLLGAAVILLLLGTGQIVHFIWSAAHVNFPFEVLTKPWNWIFIGIHALLCFVGLIFLNFVFGKKFS